MSVMMTPEEVKSEIKKIETNPQMMGDGPAINSLPSERGSREGHFEGGMKKKSGM